MRSIIGIQVLNYKWCKILVSFIDTTKEGQNRTVVGDIMIG